MSNSIFEDAKDFAYNSKPKFSLQHTSSESYVVIGKDTLIINCILIFYIRCLCSLWLDQQM